MTAKNLTTKNLTAEDWIIIRLLCQIINDDSKKGQFDIDVTRTLVYIGKKYPDLVLKEAALLLKEERKHGK